MFYVPDMRTTLDIDEDVLLAAKDLARRDHKPMGKVISELARKTLAPGKIQKFRNGVPLFPTRNGFPLLPSSKGKGKIVTMELVNRLRDEGA